MAHDPELTGASVPSAEDPAGAAERYRQLLDTVPDAIVVIGPSECITLINVQTERMFGYPHRELLGRRLELLVPGRSGHDDQGHVARFFQNPVARSMGSGLKLVGRRRDGSELPIEVSLSPVETGGIVSVSVAIRDLTEDSRLSEELRIARATTEAASAAKSEFLSSMSHELRTPLNAILGFAQLLQGDKKEPLSHRHRERVARIVGGGEHLLRLIDDILDLSHIEDGRVSISNEPVKIVDVLEEICATLDSSATRNDLRMELIPPSEGLPLAVADRTRLAQILMNFGSNAIKYNRPGGTVTFTISQPHASRIRVTVSDTGSGVPKDKQDKLFQPFQRAGQETGPIEGTGIGLVISKRLAELMGGQVGFRSTPGVGSDFWLDLDALCDTATRIVPVANLHLDTTALVSGPKRPLLYVEDNPANVEFIRDLMNDFEGVALLTAPTAEMGIELARARRPHVILMDINLPGMSGVDALRQLQSDPITRSIPVIALTATASERDQRYGLHAGFYRYLTKPVKVDELVATLLALWTRTEPTLAATPIER